MISIKIFLISGKARAGKTEVAGIICDHYNSFSNIYADIFSFGDYVKEVAENMGWNGYKDEKGRTLLQEIGQAGRKYNINIWVDKCINDIKYSNPDIVAIDDVRFINEIERIKQEYKNVITIRVNRPNFKSDLTDEQLNDISETELDNYQFDFIIENDGDLEDLKRKVLEIVD